MDNQEAALDFTRLVSSFRGSGPVASDRMIFDYDPMGGVIPGLRAIVNNSVVQTGSPPAGMADPGFHHYALVADNGTVTLYFDGAAVASGAVGTGATSTANIHIGEDPHDGGGSADEQLIGLVDEFLLIDRALSANEILALQTSDVDAVVTPAGGEYAVYYDFAGDLGDRFAADGAQNAMPIRQATLDVPAGAGRLALPVPEPFSRINVGPVGNLGGEVTMSATVLFPQAGYSNGGLTRLFSTYNGSGAAAGRLIVDFNPFADISDIGFRTLLPDGTAAFSTDPIALDQRHTLTVTYDTGDLRLYVDGSEVAAAMTSGDVDLGGFPLYVGEDAAFVVNENFIGTMDDVIFLARALSPAEVGQLHDEGVRMVLTPEPRVLGMALIGALALAGRGWARRRRG